MSINHSDLGNIPFGSQENTRTLNWLDLLFKKTSQKFSTLGTVIRGEERNRFHSAIYFGPLIRKCSQKQTAEGPHMFYRDLFNTKKSFNPEPARFP